MSGLSLDRGLYRKALLGALAAGSGLAVYYGYTKWKTRPRDNGSEADDSEQKSHEPPKEDKDKEGKDISVTLTSDPEAPLQTSTPGVSRASSTDTNQDLLSLSGSFEKVSLSALREQNGTDESLSGQKSPSESFEKVSLPAKDAPLVDVTQSGSEVTGKESSTSENINKDTTADNNNRVNDKSGAGPNKATEPRVQFEEKVVKHDSPSVQAPSPKPQPELVKPLVPTPAPAKPELVKPLVPTPAPVKPTPGLGNPTVQPKTDPPKQLNASATVSNPVPSSNPEAQSSLDKPASKTLPSRIPQPMGISKPATESSVKVTKEEEHDRDSLEEDDDEEDDDDDGSESDASGDSQITRDDTVSSTDKHGIASAQSKLIAGSNTSGPPSNEPDSQTKVKVTKTTQAPKDESTKPLVPPDNTMCAVLEKTVPNIPVLKTTEKYAMKEQWLLGPILTEKQGPPPATKTVTSESDTKPVNADLVGRSDSNELHPLGCNTNTSSQDYIKRNTSTQCEPDSPQPIESTYELVGEWDAEPTTTTYSSLLGENHEPLKDRHPTHRHTDDLDSYRPFVDEQTPDNLQSNSIPDDPDTYRHTPQTYQPQQSPIIGHRKWSMTSTSSTSSTKDADNILYTHKRLQQCFDNVRASTSAPSRIEIGDPANRSKKIDLGITIQNPSNSSSSFGHMISLVDQPSLANDIGLRVGESLVGVNDAIVNEWRQDVLLAYMSRIDGSDFVLTVHPKPEHEKRHNIVRDITVKVLSEKGRLIVKPHSVDRLYEANDRSAIELGEFTPKLCHMQIPGSGEYVMRSGSRLCVGSLTKDEAAFEMMRLLYSRTKASDYQTPVTMMAFSSNNILYYLCALNTNTITLMSQKELCHNVDTLNFTDCRFFQHKFVAGFDVFESTIYPEHYLSCEERRLSLKHVANAIELGLDTTTHFNLHYLFVPAEETTEL